VERELTARLIDDVLGQPAMLPLLSNALLRTWQGLGHDACDLYRGKRLAIAERLFLDCREPGEPTGLESEFLMASRRDRDAGDSRKGCERRAAPAPSSRSTQLRPA